MIAYVLKMFPRFSETFIVNEMLELRRRGIDTSSMLYDLGLPTDIPASHDLFIASTTIYELVEESARLAEDPFLGFAVGSALDLADWDPIMSATESANTVGELLTMFAVNAAEHSTARRRAIYVRLRTHQETGVPPRTERCVLHGLHAATSEAGYA